MSRQTERDLGAELQENLKQWWDNKYRGQKLAIGWLATVALIMVILTFIYPSVMIVIWLVLFGIVAISGAIVAIMYLVDPF